MALREIQADEITQAIKELCVDVNTKPDPELEEKLKSALDSEISRSGQEVLSMMLKNFEIARDQNLPICQDTGMAVVFADVGQDLHIVGGDFETAVNEGVRQGYEEGYLRKSVVSDPIERVNTGDNTPAVIHTRIVPGDRLTLTVIAKGFGSENTSALAMLKPSDGLEGVERFAAETILKAIPNGCAPLVVGVGVGGDFEVSAINAKRALTLGLDHRNPNPTYGDLEQRLLAEANNSGIGPMGLGGVNSVLAVNVIQSPTHIAGLPVAVNICCYVDRVGRKVV